MFRHVLLNCRSVFHPIKDLVRHTSQNVTHSHSCQPLALHFKFKNCGVGLGLSKNCLSPQGKLNVVRHYGTGPVDPGPDLLSLEEDTRRQKKNVQPLGNTEWKQDKRQKRKGSSYNFGLHGKGKISYTAFVKGDQISVQGEILFGIFPVLLALREGRRQLYSLHIKRSLLDSAADKPHMNEIINLADKHDIEVLPTDVRSLNSLSAGRPHQGVCLDADRLQFSSLSSHNGYEMSHYNSTKSPQLWIVLDSVQDPMNFGAILRTSYFLGVDQVITVKGESCPPTPVVSKASAGVLELLPVWTVDSIAPFIQHKKADGWHVIGTVGEKCNSRTLPLCQTNLKSNTILLMGNEGRGMSEEVESLCDTLVTIQPGRHLATNMESLNVSVATGIVLYHLLSQRQ